MKIAFTPAGWRDFQKLPKREQTRLKSKLVLYSSDPLSHAAKLTDTRIGQYRFRIGDYRVVFDLTKGEMVILAVGHRKDIYR